MTAPNYLADSDAFPRGRDGTGGMTYREWLAGTVLAALASRPAPALPVDAGAAALAYEAVTLADALITALAGKGRPR